MILVLLLAAAQPAPTPGWLAGRWFPLSEASRQDSQACTDDGTVDWFSDGRFERDDMSGDWRLARGRVVETGDDGETRVSRIERVGPDRLRLTDPDGERIDYRRCR